MKIEDEKRESIKKIFPDAKNEEVPTIFRRRCACGGHCHMLTREEREGEQCQCIK